MTNAMMFNFTTGLALDLTNITGTISFSTIVSATTGTPSTVNCPDGGTVRASIIWAPGSTAAPIAGCNLANAFVGPTAVAGASSTDPKFLNAAGSDYHLSPASPAIDQLATGPAVDFEGDARPQGSAWISEPTSTSRELEIVLTHDEMSKNMKASAFSCGVSPARRTAGRVTAWRLGARSSRLTRACRRTRPCRTRCSVADGRVRRRRRRTGSSAGSSAVAV